MAHVMCCVSRWQHGRLLKMDYMVYVDNSNDRFSLLDMIEKDCEALDSDEKWRVSHSADVFHTDKNKLFCAEARQSVQSAGDPCWMDSAIGKAASNIRQSSASDVAVGMNRDPHLLVNPRTVAPVLEKGASKVAVAAASVTDHANAIKAEPEVGDVSFSEVEPNAKMLKVEPDVADVSFSEAEPSSKMIKIEPVDVLDELFSTQSQIVSLTNNDQTYSAGTALIAPAPVNVSSPVGTMQLFLQVASTVGNIVQTGGNVCFVVEPQTLCTTTVAHNSIAADNVSVSAGPQSVDTDVSLKDETGSEAYEKPVFSYSCLIAMALKNSDTGSLPVNEIYAYIL